jgi:hypothetical protein
MPRNRIYIHRYAASKQLENPAWYTRWGSVVEASNLHLLLTQARRGARRKRLQLAPVRSEEIRKYPGLRPCEPGRLEQQIKRWGDRLTRGNGAPEAERIAFIPHSANGTRRGKAPRLFIQSLAAIGICIPLPFYR